MTKKSYLLWDVGMSKIGETTPFEQNVVLPASILSNLGEWNGIISPSRNIWEKLQEQPAVISLQYTSKKGNATFFPVLHEIIAVGDAERIHKLPKLGNNF